MSSYKQARTDLWLAELTNGYALLKDSINPILSEENADRYSGSIDRALESFLVYAEEGANLEATAAISNVFICKENNPYDSIYAGTALGGYYLYRQEALRIYSMLDMAYNFETTAEIFVFDEEEFMSTVTQKYEIEIIEAQPEDAE